MAIHTDQYLVLGEKKGIIEVLDLNLNAIVKSKRFRDMDSIYVIQSLKPELIIGSDVGVFFVKFDGNDLVQSEESYLIDSVRAIYAIGSKIFVCQNHDAEIQVIDRKTSTVANRVPLPLSAFYSRALADPDALPNMLFV